MPEPLTALPESFTAGETVVWTHAVSETDFVSGGDYTLKAYLRGPSALDLTAVADDAGQWEFTITAAQSATLAAGTYTVAIVAEGTIAATLERHPVARQTVTVQPNVVTAVAGDFVSPAKRLLDAIDAVLEDRVTADVAAYTIGGRAVTAIPIMELTALRGIYAAKVARERSGGRAIRAHHAVFRGW